jgi:putative transposase
MALEQDLLEVLEALETAGVNDRDPVRGDRDRPWADRGDRRCPHERADSRNAQRNAYRPRTLSTTAGDLSCRIRIPCWDTSPSLLERHRRVDQCLFAVAMQAHLHGTSTRTVDDLVKARWAPTPASAI